MMSWCHVSTGTMLAAKSCLMVISRLVGCGREISAVAMDFLSDINGQACRSLCKRLYLCKLKRCKLRGFARKWEPVFEPALWSSLGSLWFCNQFQIVCTSFSCPFFFFTNENDKLFRETHTLSLFSLSLLSLSLSLSLSLFSLSLSLSLSFLSLSLFSLSLSLFSLSLFHSCKPAFLPLPSIIHHHKIGRQPCRLFFFFFLLVNSCRGPKFCLWALPSSKPTKQKVPSSFLICVSFSARSS